MAIILMILLVVPANAASIRHIDTTIAENGDAVIVADYSLDWAEQAFVYPAVAPLIAGLAGKNVQIHSITPGEAQLTALHFATVVRTSEKTTYTTTSFGLAEARKKLDSYWFGNMVTLDGASGSLTLRFPDGEIIEYPDLTSVPSFEHAVART